MTTKHINVVVIGGGCAGLTAAAELSSNKHFDVTLVEAANCLGGRVRQAKPFKGCQWLDVGGEFIHGNKTLAIELANRLGWEYEGMTPEFLEYRAYGYIKNELQLLDESNSLFIEARTVAEQFLESGRELRRSQSKKCICIPKTEPLIACAVESCTDSCATDEEGDTETELTKLRKKDISFDDFLTKLGIADSDCRSFIDTFYCKTEGNDLNRIGMMELSRAEDNWEYGDGDLRLKNSYRNLMEHLVQKCDNVNMKLNWQVTHIDWKIGNEIHVTSKDGECVQGNYIIITVPLTILKDGDITFTPELPDSKQRTLQMMEMRNGCKMFCTFSKAFWPKDMAIVYNSNYGPFPQIWTEHNYECDGNDFYILCGFTTGSSADEAGKCKPDVLKDRFLAQLDLIFRKNDDLNPASNSFVEYYFYDWGSDPFVRGSYASPVVGSYAVVESLAEPIENILFFGGEATNMSSTSTVQSAIDSGTRAAKEVMTFCGLRSSSEERTTDD